MYVTTSRNFRTRTDIDWYVDKVSICSVCILNFVLKSHEVSVGLAFLHSKKIVHADIKGVSPVSILY